MNAKAFVIGILLMIPAVGHSHHISGKVLDAKSKKAIEFATVWIEGTGIGTITDINGHFLLPHLSEGSYDLVIRCLGYTESKRNVSLTSNTEVVIYLSELSMALDEVTITAEKNVQEATTYTLNQTALDHLQSVCVTDALSLLPGGQTSKYKTLTSGQVVTLRGETQEMGNPDFGTVVEMDGVRLSSNATALTTEGTDLRNVGYHHIEKIDVITGVPSVEYGDLTNGVVKIVTKKGKSPLQADIAIRPHIQSYALNKGIDLGGKRGVVNLSYERARSVSDLASPFTSYTRNALGIKYSNTFHYASDRSLLMDLSLNGNLGGLDSESDPDAFKETYTKKRDYALWSSLSFQYLIHSAWLSNLQWGLTFAYSDKQSEVKANKSSSSALPALHTTEEGYFVASKYEENPSSPILLLPTGYWYVTTYTDNRPVSYSAYVKAKWTHKRGAVTNNILLGSDIKSEGNLGRGEYYTDLSVAPDWREYRYDKLPYMTNWSLFAEEDLSIKFKHSSLNLRAGVRNVWYGFLFQGISVAGLMKYLIPLSGIAMAIVQFTPEMTNKRFKLTLHLPASETGLISAMLLYGYGMLSALFLSSTLLLSVIIGRVLPTEVVWMMVSQFLPWITAALAGYGLTVWICTEPSWRQRISNMPISVGLLSVWFVSTYPEAYSDFGWGIILAVALSFVFPFYSCIRFKQGIQ